MQIHPLATSEVVGIFHILEAPSGSFAIRRREICKRHRGREYLETDNVATAEEGVCKAGRSSCAGRSDRSAWGIKDGFVESKIDLKYRKKCAREGE